MGRLNLKELGYLVGLVLRISSCSIANKKIQLLEYMEICQQAA